MTTQDERYSTLRRGVKIPPPTPASDSENITYSEATHTALLHSAFAVRGGAFLCILV